MSTTGLRVYRFLVVIEKEADAADFTAYSPTLPGCFTRGATIEEARRKIREIAKERVATLRAADQPLGDNDRLIRVEEMSLDLADGRARRRNRPARR